MGCGVWVWCLVWVVRCRLGCGLCGGLRGGVGVCVGVWGVLGYGVGGVGCGMWCVWCAVCGVRWVMG